MKFQKLSVERKDFEIKWNHFNDIRAGTALLVSLMLVIIQNKYSQ